MKLVANAFLEAITPAALDASLLAFQQLQANRDAALQQWRLEVERARYEAERAERRYRSVEPENRLVARGLETEWESRLRDLAAAENELRHREQSMKRYRLILALCFLVLVQALVKVRVPSASNSC
jgi:hypothetical protein